MTKPERKHVVVALVCIFLIFALPCAIYFGIALEPHSTNEFFNTNENIVSISFYAMTNRDTDETRQFFLDSVKFEEFLNIAKSNKYRDWHNWKMLKCQPMSSVLYIIEYETCYIEFGDVDYCVYDKENNQPLFKHKLYTTLTKDNFDKLYTLFDAPNGIYPLGYNEARNNAA
ncbi:MAG: hypothetical protein IJ226_03480 [Clostridia bacterium]|nr:hypothetical protein [Clostridia bacterium]